MTAVETDPGLRFWLNYVEREGALVEEGGEAAFVVLPSELQGTFDLPDQLTVTADPGAAREEGALLVATGHPMLDDVASRVLSEGDVGVCHLAWPASEPPSPPVLQAWAREQLPVDHGRIDAHGPPLPMYLPVLRVGALVTYSVSLDQRFQEREEVWVDGLSGIALGADSSAALAAHPRGPAVRGRTELPLDPHLALAEANAVLEQAADRRLAALVKQSPDARRQEMAQADTYYKAALASIDRRRLSASPERRQLLAAQADATRMERARRLAEIEEKFTAQRQIQPFRAHLLLVPALRLAVQVLRGRRVYPFSLTWVLPLSAFAPPRCPHCASPSPLVAGRDRLGCRRCLARPPHSPPGLP